jgi:hypothetical protein
MEGDQEFLNKVQVEVLDGVLSINYNSNMTDWTGLSWIGKEHRVHYFVTLKELNEITLDGAGSIHAETLHGDSLTLKHSGLGRMVLKDLRFKDLDVDLGGLGEIRLTGEVQSQRVDLNGAGSYDGVGLKSQHSDVTISGAGSVRVWVEDSLKANVSGPGSIKYKGSPSVEKTNTGVGSIKPL